MGGGDLNTKKSWHPNTAKNQEKVWKAEQQKAQEDKKMEELRREIDRERSKEELVQQGQSSGVLPEKTQKNLDWMYKEPHEGVDREQYLLGKAIDKTFEKMVVQESASMVTTSKNHVEHECIPFSMRTLSQNRTARENQVDMARKLMEDPLVAIRKREVESRTQLLQNPVKLKELSMLLKAEQMSKKLKKEKKKGKKHKKDKLEEKIREKLKKLGGNKLDMDINDLLSSRNKDKNSKKKKKKKHKHSSSSDSDSSDESEDDSKKRKKVKRTTKERDVSDEDSDSDRRNKRISKNKSKNDRCIPKEDKRRRDSYSKERDEKRKLDRSGKRDRYSDKSRNQDSNLSKDDMKRFNLREDEKHKNYGLVKADGSVFQHKRDAHDDNNDRKRSSNATWEKPKRPKLTEKEMEEKRREMMKDAVVRDRERESNIKYYKKLDSSQEMKDKSDNFEKDFIEKQLRVAASNSSLESRIKSNIYNIQRSHGSMDTNFARRK